MEIKDIIKPENLTYCKSKLLTDNVYNFCPGCGHGTAMRLLAEVIEEMGIAGETIGVGSVGCSVLIYEYLDLDMIGASHGRAGAVATGVKRVEPDKFVFSYQGDGDLAAIGTAETIHVCNRGDNIMMVYINNGIYGMTGGQMAPTTIEGMKTATSPFGRDIATMGGPIKMSNLVAQLNGTYYVTRQSVHNSAAVRRTKKAFRTALEAQKLNKGTTFIEIMSNCNTGWKLSPAESNKWLETNMLANYPLGDIKVDGKMI